MSIQAMKQALEALRTCENYLEHREPWLEEAAQELAAAVEAAEKVESALTKYKQCTEDEAPPTPLERLRFFCSLAMNGQDWLDVEPFFDAIAEAERQEPVAWGIDWGTHGDRSCCSIIKKHPDGTMEVVASEYSPTPQPAIPAGMALVPVEPTEEEIQAGVKESKRIGVPLDWLSICYIRKAMLAAAPKPENSHD